MGLRASLVVLDLLIDEKSTTIIVDEGASPFGMVNSFGWLGFLFAISNYMEQKIRVLSLHSFSKKQLG
jgi:hypothetical protein